MSDVPEVLFVCVHNAGRSQMAAALLHHHAGGRVRVRSAGSAPADEVNPAVVQVMAEVGLDLSHEFPKPLTDEAARTADVVVTMGCGDACPVYPGQRYEDWQLDDPAGKSVEDVRTIRDEIERRVIALAATLPAPERGGSGGIAVPIIPTDDPVAVAAVEAIHRGDVATLKRLLDENPGLANTALGNEGPDGMTRSLLHVVTDWPGHFPNGATTVTLLVDAGAEPDARFTGPHRETPLHWAASSDDVEVLDALLDAGADIEARGAVIAGGTPVADATAFGQWNAARRLVERGARTNLWESSALGLQERVESFFAVDPPPDATEAFWAACHGGQLATAQFLLDRGADINWVGYDNLTPLEAARRSDAGPVIKWLHTHAAKMANDCES